MKMAIIGGALVANAATNLCIDSFKEGGGTVSGFNAAMANTTAKIKEASGGTLSGIVFLLAPTFIVPAPMNAMSMNG